MMLPAKAQGDGPANPGSVCFAHDEGLVVGPTAAASDCLCPWSSKVALKSFREISQWFVPKRRQCRFILAS